MRCTRKFLPSPAWHLSQRSLRVKSRVEVPSGLAVEDQTLWLQKIMVAHDGKSSCCAGCRSWKQALVDIARPRRCEERPERLDPGGTVVRPELRVQCDGFSFPAFSRCYIVWILQRIVWWEYVVRLALNGGATGISFVGGFNHVVVIGMAQCDFDAMLAAGRSLFLDSPHTCCSHPHQHESGFSRWSPTLKGDVEIAMYTSGSLSA